MHSLSTWHLNSISPYSTQGWWCFADDVTRPEDGSACGFPEAVEAELENSAKSAGTREMNAKDMKQGVLDNCCLDDGGHSLGQDHSLYRMK